MNLLLTDEEIHERLREARISDPATALDNADTLETVTRHLLVGMRCVPTTGGARRTRRNRPSP